MMTDREHYDRAQKCPRCRGDMAGGRWVCRDTDRVGGGGR